jgi:phosphatidate cytidylyltransferase
VTKAEKGIVTAFSIVCIPACALFESVLFGGGHGVEVTFAVWMAECVCLLALLVISHENTSLEGLGLSLLSSIYPTLLLCLLVLTNHLDGGAFSSNLAILFIFVVSPVADSLAYVFGRSFKKYFPQKMAPTLSPNKTIIGGIGGLFGGVLGGGVLYLVYNAIAGSFDMVYKILPLYLLIGLLIATATAFGDLIESCIKRKAGIKDMGKIMPGHGGVLDRIDGSIYATIVVYVSFLLIRAIL